mgnify:CR=1 FL=1
MNRTCSVGIVFEAAGCRNGEIVQYSYIRYLFCQFHFVLAYMSNLWLSVRAPRYEQLIAAISCAQKHISDSDSSLKIRCVSEFVDTRHITSGINKRVGGAEVSVNFYTRIGIIGNPDLR